MLEVAILRDQVRQFEDTLLKRQFETNQKILLEVANLRNQVDKFEKSSMNKNATMSDEIDKRLETINGSFSERIDAVIQKLESKSNPGFDFNEDVSDRTAL